MASIQTYKGTLKYCWGADADYPNRLKASIVLNGDDCQAKVGTRFTYISLHYLHIIVTTHANATVQLPIDSYTISVDNGVTEVLKDQMILGEDRMLNITVMLPWNLNDKLIELDCKKAALITDFQFYVNSSAGSELLNHTWNYRDNNLLLPKYTAAPDPAIFCPINGYELPSNEPIKKITIEPMTLEDFKVVAAQKLNVDIKRIHVKPVFKDISLTNGQIVNLIERDNKLACFYFQNISTQLNGDIIITDVPNLTAIRMSDSDQKGNFFGNKIESATTGNIQITGFIAERIF